jgi:hypothetical protein
VRTAVDERLAQQRGENRAPAATAAQQSQLAEQVDDERLAREAETDASPPRREDADASVGEVGAGDALEREEEAAPTATNTPVSEAPLEQPPPSASTTETLLPQVLRGGKVKNVAAVLLRTWPERPPDLDVDAMLTFVRTTIRVCNKATVERAIRRLTALGQWASSRQTRLVRQFPSVRPSETVRFPPG